MPNWTNYEPMDGMPFGTGMFTDENGVKGGPYHLPNDAALLAQNTSAPPLTSAPEPMMSVAPPTPPPVAADVAPPMAPPAPKTNSYWSNLDPSEQQAARNVAGQFGGLTPEQFVGVLGAGESGKDGKINPKAKNASGASGAYQLMPDQWENGVDPATKPLAKQLEDYPSYLQKHGIDPKSIRSPGDIGVAQAAPALLTASDDTLAPAEYQKGSKAWEQNPGWRGPDGVVTRGSIAKYYENAYAKATGETPQGRASTGDPQLDYARDVLDAAGRPKETTSTKQRIEAGIPYTDEQRAAAQGRLDHTNAGLTAAFDPAIKVNQEFQAKQDLQHEQLLGDAADAKLRMADAEKEHAEWKGRIEKSTQDVLDHKEPPPFGGNMFAGVLAAIGSALGAYGASINHTENFAQNNLNRMLAQDHEKWRQQHLDKEYKVTNEKELSKEAWYKFKDAELARRATQQNVIAHEASQFQTRVQGAEQQKTLETLKLNAQNEFDKLDEQRRALAQDRVTTERDTQRQDVTDPLVARNNAAQQLEEGGVGRDKITQARQLNGEPVDLTASQKETTAYEQGNAKTPGAEALRTGREGIAEIAKYSGLVKDEKTGKYRVAKPADDKRPPEERKAAALRGEADTVGGADAVERMPFTGSMLPSWAVAAKHPLQALGVADNSELTRKQNALNAIEGGTAKLTHDLSGAVFTKSERAIYQAQLAGQSPETQAESLNRLLEHNLNAQKALDTAYPNAAKVLSGRQQKQRDKENDFTPDAK